MFGIGSPEIMGTVGGIILVAIIAAVLSRRGGARVVGPTLALRKMKVNEAAPDGFVIDIDGRSSGLIAWCLTVLGFKDINNLRVTNTDLTIKTSSLFGQIHNVVPLTSVSFIRCGYSKPIGYLIIGVILVLIGLYQAITEHGGGAGIIVILLVGIIFIAAYWLLKKMAIVVETYGGTSVGLAFKRSVIENVSVDIDKALEAIRLINKKVLEAQGLKPAVTVEPAKKPAGVCSKCGHKNTPEDVFCVECGERI